MIREMLESDKNDYFAMADEFYRSAAVSHPVPKACFAANFKEMTGAKTYLEGYIFENDGAVAGFAAVAKTFSSEAGGLCVWIEDFFVKSEFRGKGLGKEFLNFLQKKYLWSAKRIRFEVVKTNARAVELYRRNGFDEMPYMQMFKDL